MRLFSLQSLLSAAAVVGAVCQTSTAQAQLSVDAVAGRPFGVARIEYAPRTGRADAFANGGVRVTEKDGRVLYPALEGTAVRRLLGALRGDVATTNVSGYFLFRGDAPLELTLHAPKPIKIRITPVSNARVHGRYLRRWWGGYTGAAKKWGREDSYPGQVENYLISMLSRRLDLRPPVINRGWSTTEQLDSVLGTLLGSESVRIAMQKDRLLSSGANSEPAVEAMPKPVEIRPIEYPEVRGAVKIEPIAMRVPEECLYIRFGTYANFQWIRDAMHAAGTDTRNIISMRGLAYDTNERMQKQLALRETAVGKLFAGTVISDVAIIGTDTFMREGASTGILFEARNSALLGREFNSQRAATMKDDPTIREEKVKIAGHEVSFLSRPDNRVRSYYAVDGSYHLITTSRYIVERFFDAGAGRRALGGSKEYRYARSIMPLAREDTVFIYLSDAFFSQSRRARIPRRNDSPYEGRRRY